MATVKALQLQQHLKDAPRPPVCIISGADEALRAYSLRIVRQAWAALDDPGSSLREFDTTPEARDVFDELRTAPFMGMAGQRTVVVNDALAFLQTHGKRVAAYLKSPSSTSMLILCMGEPPKKKRRKKKASDSAQPVAKRAAKEDTPAKQLAAALRAVRAKGLAVDCASPTWRDAEQYARDYATSLGVRLAGRTPNTLVQDVGPNVLALEQEVAKLAAYCAPRDTITEADVGEIVSAGRSRSIFDLRNAVARGDAAEALHLCERLLLRGEKREGIIGFLGRQVRQLWQVKRLKAQGVPDTGVARQIGVPPFAAERSAQLVRNLPETWFSRQLKLLSDADAESKERSLRTGEEQAWLENLLVRMCER